MGVIPSDKHLLLVWQHVHSTFHLDRVLFSLRLSHSHTHTVVRPAVTTRNGYNCVRWPAFHNCLMATLHIIPRFHTDTPSHSSCTHLTRWRFVDEQHCVPRFPSHVDACGPWLSLSLSLSLSPSISFCPVLRITTFSSVWQSVSLSAYLFFILSRTRNHFSNQFA